MSVQEGESAAEIGLKRNSNKKRKTSVSEMNDNEKPLITQNYVQKRMRNALCKKRRLTQYAARTSTV